KNRYICEKFEIMAQLRYPVGMQTFSNIIEEGYVYVDKTGYIKPLLEQSKYIFLSRPRRFGKSLLLSTLKAYFEGRRELFKGLAADSMDLDWTPSPVLRFDFNAENYSEEDGLSKIINRLLGEYEEIYEMTNVVDTLAGRFSRLIREVAEASGRKVVILIDEYDKPLLDIEENKALFEKNQRILKSFFGNLKSMDEYIRFAFITGVSRFSKVSIFSDLNNLDDISMENDYADICGWTEDEILFYFRLGIDSLANEREEEFDETLRVLRGYYDGYLFALKGSRLYNPYSVLKALKKKEIDPYWFESGTPIFLARRVKAKGIFPPDINGQMCTKKELTIVGMDDSNPFPLMFQTGYLTIASYDKDMQLYTLRFPNREVEIGFYEDLMRVYVPDSQLPDSPFRFPLFKQDLFGGRPYDFMQRLASLLKDLPGEDHRESSYRAITYLLAVLSGSYAMAELHSYKGRSDLEVLTGKYIYIFEFKYNKSVEEAMEQIQDRDYAGRYAMDNRTVYLIGANFNEKKEERGLEYKIEKLK
ncbi:MAG: ATP-binding protein, partial [Muribaculaceae bacterium]|nr:ATP-binding protein [Muribaculaceae bacterium]